jgi:hypothetical protein
MSTPESSWYPGKNVRKVLGSPSCSSTTLRNGCAEEGNFGVALVSDPSPPVVTSATPPSPPPAFTDDFFGAPVNTTRVPSAAAVAATAAAAELAEEAANIPQKSKKGETTSWDPVKTLLDYVGKRKLHQVPLNPEVAFFSKS